MNVVEVLKMGRDRIFYKENWMQGAGADGHGRFCAVGALGLLGGRRFIPVQLIHDATYELNETAIKYGYETVVELNDKTTHDFVMRVYDETITRLTLPGKSKTITVEPVTVPKETPAPEPIPEPVEVPEREPVPA